MRRLALLFMVVFFGREAGARPVTLYLNWFPSVQFAGILEARDRGFYRRAGIELNLVFDAVDTLNSIASGKADIGMVSGHEVIQSVAAGKPVKAFAAHYQLNPHTIITSADSSIKELRNLKGKVVGIFSAHEYPIYKVMLADVGLTLGDVKIVAMKSNDEKHVVKCLQRGDVDAVMAWEFHWPVIFGLLGHRVRQFPSYKYGFHYYGSVFTTNARFLRTQRPLLEAFVRATSEGWKEVYRHPDETAAKMVRRYYPREHYINGSADLTEREQRLELKLNKRFLFEGVSPEQYGMMSNFAWTKSIASARANGLIPATSNLTAQSVSAGFGVGVTPSEARE